MPIKKSSKLAKVSLIILNRNGKELTLDCLRSVFATRYPRFEVILVDNGSADGSPEIIEKKFGNKKNFRLVKSLVNLGFAGGNNRGAKEARGNYLLFLNNDTEVEKNWLTNLMQTIQSLPQFGAASPKQRSLVKKNYLDALGGELDPLGWSLKVGYKEKDKGQYDQVKEVFYAQGSSFLIPKKLFVLVGGFDKDYTIYYEEVDLCWRLHLAGYKVYFIPQSVIYHLGGGWQKTQTDAKIFYLLRRNHLRTLIKNYESGNLLWVLPLAFSFIFVSAIILFFKGESRRSLAYFRALGRTFIDLTQTLSKRRSVQRNIRKVMDKEIRKIFWPKILFFSQFLK